MPCLTLLGTASIQDYVFRSNRLRENLGGSGLVGWAMHSWQESDRARKLLLQSGGEVLYVGGGNAALRFPSKAHAQDAIRQWSCRMLKCAPGLRLIAAHNDEYREGELAEAFEKAQHRLTDAENRAPLGLEPGALPVIRPCPSTGLAASEKAAVIRGPDEPVEPVTDEEEVEDDPRAEDYPAAVWLSAEAQAKRDHFWQHVRRRFSKRYAAALRDDRNQRHYRFPSDLNQLGTTSGASQIALVHADGNSIGALLRNLIERHREIRNDAEFLKELHTLSNDISSIAHQAFADLIAELVRALPDFEAAETVALCHSKKDGKPLLPMRPIVDEGDDLTFVCHGKLGLALAVRYLQLFERNGVVRGLTASAGIVVMPQKLPFAQAYALTEDLCSSAKRACRKSSAPGSWIDFHLQMEGRTGSLETFRNKQYPRWSDMKLPARPFGVTGPDGNSWRQFEDAWCQLADGDKWPRSKAKRLFEAYSAGPREVESLMGHFQPSIKPIVFDALEFLDFHLKWPVQ